MKKLIAVAGLGAALIVSPLLTSCASAGASSGAEDRFIARLDDGGIPYPSEDVAIEAGHSVCNSIDEGYTVDEVTEHVYRNTPATAYEAGYIVGASVYAFCDEYGDQIA